MSTPPVVQAVLPCKLMSLHTCAGICAQPVHTHSCQTRHAAICSGAHGLSCSFKTVCMLQVLEPFLVWACCVSSAGTELMVISCGVHLHLGVSSCTFCRQHRLAVQSANCLHPSLQTICMCSSVFLPYVASNGPFTFNCRLIPEIHL